MFFTARQLETLHREGGGNGQLVLPYRARLTPAAQDWLKIKKLVIGYSDDSATPFRGRSPNAVSGGTAFGADAGTGSTGAGSSAATAPLLWWCDGPCGPAKAALMAQAKESPARAVDLTADANQLVPAIKSIAAELKAGTTSAGVLFVQTAAVATVFANRCPSIRAVVGTSLEAVEQGIRLTAANVLVVEHPNKTLHQVKSLLARFAKAKRELSPDLLRQLAEMASCG
jgi:hypothetical protein